jgi:cytoskeletal protein RodZ
MTGLNPSPVRKNSLLPRVLIGLFVILLILVGVWWWQNRPIQPVVLSPQEKTVVEAKVEAIQKPAEPTYEKGGKEIILTERELNGLLNANTVKPLVSNSPPTPFTPASRPISTRACRSSEAGTSKLVPGFS